MTADFERIISYMLRQILPTVSIVTVENLKQLQSIDTPLVIAFIDEHDQASREVFTSIAEGYKDQFIFGVSSDNTLAGSESGSLKPPFIVLHSASDHINRIFSDEFECTKLKRFLGRTATPLIGKFSMETYYTYTQVSVTRGISSPNVPYSSDRHSRSYPSSTSSPKQNKSDNLSLRLSSMLLRNTRER